MEFDEDFLELIGENENLGNDIREYEKLYIDELKLSTGIGCRGVSKRRRNDPNSAPEISSLLRAAHECYILKDFTEAEEYCRRVIAQQPRAHRAFSLLALIAEENGHMRKALSMYLVIAHLTQRKKSEAQLCWHKLAMFAKEHGTKREMEYCLRKSLKTTPTNTVVPWYLCCYYEELNRVSPQIELVKHLLEHCTPHNMVLVRKLVGIYWATGQRAFACNLLHNSLQAHLNNNFIKPWEPPTEENMQEKVTVTEGFVPLLDRIHVPEILAESGIVSVTNGGFKFDDLYLASDLLLCERRHGDLLVLIKKYFRFLQKRECVEELDDLEYSPLVYRPLISNSVHPSGVLDGKSGISLDFRVLLGVCRLWMNQVDIANVHFDVLREFPANLEPAFELYKIVLDAYMQTLRWKEAKDTVMLMLKSVNTGYLWFVLGLCEKNFDITKAEEAFLKAAEENLCEAYEELAYIYIDLGQDEKAANAITMAEVILRERNAPFEEIFYKRVVPQRREDFEEEESLIKLSKTTANEKERLVNKEQRKSAILAKQHEVNLKFVKLRLTYCDESFVATLEDLYCTFTKNVAFYPQDRQAMFQGMDANFTFRNTKFDDDVPETCTEYLEHPIDQWFDILMDYCGVLARLNQPQKAFQSLQRIMRANVVLQCNEKKHRLHMLGIAISVYANMPAEADQYIRWIIANQPPNPNIYRLYAIVCCKGGHFAKQAFTCSNLQKFLKRHLQQRELLDVSMMSCVFEYGNMFLAAGSYSHALAEYFKIHEHYQNNVLFNFVVALALLHKCMQRQTENRHLQVAQAVSYLQRYIQTSDQPKIIVWYNAARFYHQIGLLSIATMYYRRALDLPDSNSIRRDAAYNLSLIYIVSGSNQLAMLLFKKYLVV